MERVGRTVAGGGGRGGVDPSTVTVGWHGPGGGDGCVNSTVCGPNSDGWAMWT
jgi:hypothetical protein